MANIEIKLDSNNPNDLKAFTNLLAAFSGTTENFQTTAFTSGHTIKGEVQTAKEEMKQEVIENVIKPLIEISDEVLKGLSTDELKDLATEMGIDWASEPGKNTSAKLIRLLLKKDENSGKTETKEEITKQGTDTSSESTTTESKEETTKDATPDNAGKVTLNELKVVLGKKVDDNRDAIVAKLGTFGATKLSNLAEDHFQEMYTFLNSL